MTFVSLNTEATHEAGGRVAGVTTAKVVRNDDPQGLGRVKLSLAWREDSFETDWTRVVAPMAGSGRGTFFLPEVGDEVLVAFDRDDIRYPYVLGGLWSQTDLPPERNQPHKNDIRVLRSRKGHVVVFDDGDKGKVTIALNDGKTIEIDDDGIRITDLTNTIEMKSAAGTVKISAGQQLSLEAPQISISAQTKLELKGGGDLSASAGMVRIN